MNHNGSAHMNDEWKKPKNLINFRKTTTTCRFRFSKSICIARISSFNGSVRVSFAAKGTHGGRGEKAMGRDARERFLHLGCSVNQVQRYSIRLSSLSVTHLAWSCVFGGFEPSRAERYANGEKRNVAHQMSTLAEEFSCNIYLATRFGCHSCSIEKRLRVYIKLSAMDSPIKEKLHGSPRTENKEAMKLNHAMR